MLGDPASIEQAMPIFDYKCQACGHQFDALQKAGEAELVDCPACGQPALSKLLSAPSFQLKGSGWRRPKAEKPVQKTRRGHMFDSPVPHAEHYGSDHDHGHSSDHGHDHGHGHSHDHHHDHSHDH
jgi:putative FmdB family regulatory protein